MIQRIQSLYLLIAFLLTSILMFVPFAEIAQSGDILTFNSSGVVGKSGSVQSGLLVVAFIGLLAAMRLLIIFMFKNRPLQARLCKCSMALSVALMALIGYTAYFSFSGAQVSLKIFAVFPLIATVLDFLAMKAISKDEALVRSIDRIR